MACPEKPPTDDAEDEAITIPYRNVPACVVESFRHQAACWQVTDHSLIRNTENSYYRIMTFQPVWYHRRGGRFLVSEL